MQEIPDHRDYARYRHKAKILLETYSSGVYHPAKMFNFSRDGMYFESDYAPLPGTEIYIGIENSPHDFGADVVGVYLIAVKSQRMLLAGRLPYIRPGEDPLRFAPR